MKYLSTIALVLLASPCFAVLTRTYTVCESGCDYTSVQAAETALQQDLVANDSALTIEAQNTWVSADGFVSIAGWGTPDATRFLTVTATGAARATATWSSTAYRSEFGTGIGTIFNSTTGYTVIDGIQVRSLVTDATAQNVMGSSGINNTVKNCLIRGNTGSSIDGIDWGQGSTTAMFIYNNVIFDCPGDAINVIGQNSTILIDNNTVENCGQGIGGGSEDFAMRNNIIVNTTTPIIGNAESVTLSQENYTDAASLDYGPFCGSCGPGDQLSQSADPFVDMANMNYHLAASTAPIDAGLDLSGNFTDAIGGKTRDALFDKGADEFIAGATTPKRRRRGAANSFLEPITPERQAFAWLFRHNPKSLR